MREKKTVTTIVYLNNKLVLIMQVIIVKAISTNILANSKKTVTDMPITID